MERDRSAIRCRGGFEYEGAGGGVVVHDDGVGGLNGGHQRITWVRKPPRAHFQRDWRNLSRRGEFDDRDDGDGLVDLVPGVGG